MIEQQSTLSSLFSIYIPGLLFLIVYVRSAINIRKDVRGFRFKKNFRTIFRYSFIPLVAMLSCLVIVYSFTFIRADWYLSDFIGGSLLIVSYQVLLWTAGIELEIFGNVSEDTRIASRNY